MAEVMLDKDAFIVSKTDLKGNITYCNQELLKILNARNSDLLHKPHNIIRHSDMPKSVFKLLWHRIENKKEIFAYVKNKTLDNNYYWVYANVTASLNENGDIIGYYSVRRKANPKALNSIIPLYEKMLDLEKNASSNTQAMEASTRYLMSFIEENKTTYDKFLNELQRL